MRKELPKFFEQILNITDPWYIEILKRTKYLLLKNPNKLTKKDKVRLDELMEYQHLDTVQAYG
mgnify:FL=1